MLKIDNDWEVAGWKHALRGMRNPKNSWEKSDSGECEGYCVDCPMEVGEDPMTCPAHCNDQIDHIIGPNDHKLATTLRNAGTDHRKYMRMIVVWMDIAAPLYWWKEFDTYKVGTVANSCSTMHKIHEKEFTLDDFSHEHLKNFEGFREIPHGREIALFENGFRNTIADLNAARKLYLQTKDKQYWWQMIQLLPSSYNQRRTVMLNYEVLANMYHSRRNHKLDEWHTFCDWIERLPYSELITGKIEKEEK